MHDQIKTETAHPLGSPSLISDPYAAVYGGTGSVSSANTSPKMNPRGAPRTPKVGGGKSPKRSPNDDTPGVNAHLAKNILAEFYVVGSGGMADSPVRETNFSVDVICMNSNLEYNAS